MEFKTDEANLRADSSQTGEMDLYDELVAFSNLSPEEQKEPAPRSERADPSSQFTDGFIFADLVQPGEPVFEPIEERGVQNSGPTEQSSFELTDQAEFRPDKKSSTNPVEDFSFELPAEPASAMGRESSSARSEPDQSDQVSGADLDLAYLLRVTGPLVARGLTAFAASSLVVCRDCRSQSSSEDMFCVACGGLLEESELAEAAADVAAPGLTCDDCKYLIEQGEIFCPSCGAAI